MEMKLAVRRKAQEQNQGFQLSSFYLNKSVYLNSLEHLASFPKRLTVISQSLK